MVGRHFCHVLGFLEGGETSSLDMITFDGFVASKVPV